MPAVVPMSDLPGQQEATAVPPVPTPPAVVDAPAVLPRLGERRRRQPGWRSTDILRTAALVIAMYIGARLLWLANPLVLTAFLGVLFGLAVGAGVDHLERWRIPRGLGAPLIVFTFVALLVGFGAWIAPTLRRQSIELRHKLPESIDRLDAWMNGHPGGIISTVLGGAATEARIDSAQATAPAAVRAAPVQPGVAPAPSAPAPADTARVTQPLSLRERLGNQLSGVTRYLFPFLTSTLAVIAGLLLIIFLAIYTAIDPELYRRGMMHLFPHRARDRAGEVLSSMAIVLRRWLVAQLIGMAVIGIAVTIALLILHVRAAFALGVLSGLFEFIPTIGPVLSAIPALAMGFLDSPQKGLAVLVVFLVIHVLESHILIPLLMKGSINLPPALTILVQALMALIFGFLGLMTAVPLLAAVLVAVKMLYVQDVVGDDILLPGGRASGTRLGSPRRA